MAAQSESWTAKGHSGLYPTERETWRSRNVSRDFSEVPMCLLIYSALRDKQTKDGEKTARSPAHKLLKHQVRQTWDLHIFKNKVW